MANQMFKEAFLVKKTRFSKLHPELFDEELHKMTIEYFRNMPDDEGKFRDILAGSKVDDEYLQLWIERLGLKAEWGKI